MLYINFKGITPQNRNYSLGVKGNNKANIISFLIEAEQDDVDLSQYSAYLKVANKEHNYFDKIALDSSTDENGLMTLNWEMTRKSTHYRNLELQLQFQSDNSNDVVFQTQIVELELNETIPAEKHIEEEHPTAIKQIEDELDDHEKRIEQLEEDSSGVKEVEIEYADDELTVSLKNKEGQIISSDETEIPLSRKVDKVEGMGLSHNDFTDSDKAKLDEAYTPSQVDDLVQAETERATGVEEGLTGSIEAIEDLIPAQATPQNKLADKDFVNSSIATNTAYFKGTFNVVTDLGLTIEATHEQIATAIASVVSDPTNNDYVFVSFPDPIAPNEYTKFSRYKYNSETETWAFEFDLNNSSFTAEQWASINSGITSSKVATYDSHIADKNNPHEVTKHQVGLGNVDNTSDANKPVSNATQIALDKKQDALESGVNIKTINGQSILGSGDMPFSVDIGLSVVGGKLCITYEEE